MGVVADPTPLSLTVRAYMLVANIAYTTVCTLSDESERERERERERVVGERTDSDALVVYRHMIKLGNVLRKL